MEKTIIILLSFCVLVYGQDWQDEQTVAVCMFGQEPKGALGAHKKIGSELVEVINMSGKVSAVNITNDFKNLYSNQRGGAVSNELIKSIMSRFGVEYLCAVEISETTNGKFKLDVRLVDVATTQNTTVVISDLSSSSERENVARKIALWLDTYIAPAITYILTYNVNPTYLFDESKTSFNAGELAMVTAPIVSGYTFTGWSGASISTSNSITIPMDGNLTLTANYQKQSVAPEYTLTVHASPTYGGVVSPQFGTYSAGERVTVKAIPYSGYAFSYWSNDLSSTSNYTTITMNRDRTLIANFQEKPASSYRSIVHDMHDWYEEFSLGIGAFAPYNLGGGVRWSNGEEVAMPYSGLGGYLCFSKKYIGAFVGAGYSDGDWENAGTSNLSSLPFMQRSYINVGVFAKYPIGNEEFKLFPLVGIEYEASVFGKLKYESGNEYMFDGKNGRFQASALNVLWIKFGVGYDSYMSDNVYLRGEFLYGFRTANVFEEEYAAKNYNVGVSRNTRYGHGLTLKLGLGFILF